MLLNNELDDFTAAPGASNAFGLVGFEANLPGPGKRPLSSMSPTIVLKDGKPVLVTGTPGGSRIISAVLRSSSMCSTTRWMSRPPWRHRALHHQWMPDEVRVERGFPEETLEALRARGHQVVEPLGQTSANSIGADTQWPARRPRSTHPRRRSGGAIERQDRDCTASDSDLADGWCTSRAPRRKLGRREGPSAKAGQEISGGNCHGHDRAIRCDGNRTDRGHQPSRLLSRHEPAGAADVLGLRGGLGARRHGLHDLSAGDRHHHRAVERRSPAPPALPAP